MVIVIKTKKPITPSQRQLVQLNKKNIEKKPLLKIHIKGFKNSGSRNNFGKITIRSKGQGHKKKLRVLDFLRQKSATNIVCSIEYDPNRSGSIASTFDIYSNKFSYILAPKNLKIGDIVQSGYNAETKVAHSLPIFKIPVGSFIYNISSKLKKPAQISRSAGAFAKLIKKNFKTAQIELNSGEQKFISVKCYATIGIVSNEFAFLTKLGKAGRSRWLNRKPKVRGVAMNPVDHPHGGGEGKKAGIKKKPWKKKINAKKMKRALY